MLFTGNFFDRVLGVGCWEILGKWKEVVLAGSIAWEEIGHYERGRRWCGCGVLVGVSL